MGSFEDRLAALKSNAGSKNSRSPLNDPFYAESLIIQSKSIVGRMYSSNEYVRFKYESELNQLVKEYRVWLAEIKREERAIATKLDAMRQEQRDISKERRDLQAIKLVAKTNREFINHYKRRGIKKKNDRPVLQVPQNTGSFTFGNESKRNLFQVPQKAETLGKENKLQKVLRLPKILSKVDAVVLETKHRQRRTSLPGIASQSGNMKTVGDMSQRSEDYGKFSRATRQPEHITLVQDLLKTQQENGNITSQSNNPIKHSAHPKNSNSVEGSFNVKPGITGRNSSKKTEQVKELKEGLLDKDESSTMQLSMIRQPRILSAPKSRSNNRDILIMAARPSSASGTIFVD